MRPTKRKKEEEEEEGQQEGEQWTKRTTNYIYLQISEAFCCVPSAVEGYIVIQWPEQKLHTVIIEGKSRKVLLLGWG